MGVGDEIGEGGIALQVAQEFPMEKEAVVSFQLPEGSFVSVRVEIRNLQKLPGGQALVGCLFKNLKFEHKREIRAYVSARSEFET